MSAATSIGNGPGLGREDDGCDIVDLALMPRVPFLDVYGQRGFEAFLEELEAAKQPAHDDGILWDTEDIEEAAARDRFADDSLRAEYLNRARELLRQGKV